jgi:hypothetical protein
VTGLGAQFGPDRVRNTPISESALVAAGVGAALAGLHPVVDLNFLDFAFGAMDEIVNQAAKIRYWWSRPVPLVVRGSTGFSGGGAQHSNAIEAWFCHVPGLVVVMPSTPADAKGLIKTALRGEDPVIFCMHKMLTGARGTVGGPDDLVPFGRAVIRRPGQQVTVVTYGVMTGRVLAAAERLAADGIEAEVIDLRTLAPLDPEPDRGVGPAHPGTGGRGRGLPARRARQRDRGHRGGDPGRRAGRPGAAARGTVRPGAAQPDAARRALAVQRGCRARRAAGGQAGHGPVIADGGMLSIDCL